MANLKIGVYSNVRRLIIKLIVCVFSGLSKGDCRPFVVDGKQVGVIRPDVLRQLALHPEVFCLRSSANTTTASSQEVVELNPAFRDYAERSSRVDEVLRKFRADQTFVTLKGWRDEVILVLHKSNINIYMQPEWYLKTPKCSHHSGPSINVYLFFVYQIRVYSLISESFDWL